MSDAIDGVDLSGAMLQQARRLGVYRELVQADIVEHLAAAAPGSADLVVAADVLIYVGEPSALFEAVALVLEHGGVFALTVEAPTNAQALIFAALALLVLAFARPSAPVPLPWAKSTVVLAMDISRSMRVNDVKPTRMVAAQEAAKAFLAEVPKHIEVGLVTFAGSAQVAQRATTDRVSIVGAIDAIQMQLGTAIGNAIVVCLAELFPDHGIDLAEMTFGASRSERKAPPKAVSATRPRRRGLSFLAYVR